MRAARQQPGLKHIVEFVERRAEALNDPIFGALTLPTSAPASADKGATGAVTGASDDDGDSSRKRRRKAAIVH